MVKGAELSGKDNILFIRNSVNGRIEARYRKVGIELNAKLHKNWKLEIMERYLRWPLGRRTFVRLPSVRLDTAHNYFNFRN